MPEHSFSRLSPYDFEELVGDLLGAAWNQRLERFTAGPDDGIDLRAFAATGGKTVIQCKHTPGARFPSLISSFRRKEVPKIRKLNPDRYLLVTSLGLTPANKQALVEAAHPYIVSTADILGREELNALLREFPNVETSNFKLWFTSVGVMRRVLHNAERCQTEFEVERVTAALPLFVQSDALPRALSILKASQIVVISGVPGIGKTTLADMLLYSHLEQEYEPVVIQGSVEEARKLFDKRAKQIFYFDDFLGETFLHDRPQILEKNQDAALISFIEAVKRTKDSRFILTTREHILRKALAGSERLAASELLEHRCILELADYSVRQKARILYNHLYFGDLPDEYKAEVLRDDFFLQVVKHPNFSPRTIAWLSGYVRVKQVEVKNYQAYVMDLLDAPESIWRHAFENQISDAARSILLVLASLGHSVEAVDLKPVWEALHDHNARKYNLKTTPHEFRKTLQELEGSFIAIHSHGIAFLNPSIRDFMHLVLTGDDSYADDLIVSAIRFRQLSDLRDLAVEKHSTILLEKASDGNADYVAALRRTLLGPHLRWSRTPRGTVGTYLDTYPEGRLRWLLSWAESSRSQVVLALVRDAFEVLGQKLEAMPDTNSVMSVVKSLDEMPWVSENGGKEIRRTLLTAVLKNLRYARYYEWQYVLEYAGESKAWEDGDDAVLSKCVRQYQEDWADEEVSDCSKSELSELKDGFESLQTRFGLSFSSQLSRIEDRLAEEEEERDYDGYRGSGFGQRPTQPGQEAPATDDEIRDLFRSLA